MKISENFKIMFLLSAIFCTLMNGGCLTKKEPIEILPINNCIEPEKIEVSIYNDVKLNEELIEYMKTMPENLRNYLNMKIQNRILQHEICKNYVEHLHNYRDCLLLLLDKEEYKQK